MRSPRSPSCCPTRPSWSTATACARVSLDELSVGDVVLVRAGGRVPADGSIVEGAAELDESMITGESRPVAKAVGDRVVAGTVSTDSSLRVRVDAVGDDTALAGIQRLVADAQASRSRAQALADRFAALLFYVATAAGAITFVAWMLAGSVDDAIVRTVTVLVIACPHALGLAIPLVIALSTAVSAQAGILVKDRLALERMRIVDTVLFDKTGTLTKGAHVVTGLAASGDLDDGRGAAPRRRRSRPTASTRWPGRSSPRRRSAATSPAPASSAPSPAAASRRRSTARRTPSADRRCCASGSSRCPPTLGARRRVVGAARRRGALPRARRRGRRRLRPRGRGPSRGP